MRENEIERMLSAKRRWVTACVTFTVCQRSENPFIVKTETETKLWAVQFNVDYSSFLIAYWTEILVISCQTQSACYSIDALNCSLYTTRSENICANFILSLYLSHWGVKCNNLLDNSMLFVRDLATSESIAFSSNTTGKVQHHETYQLLII